MENLTKISKIDVSKSENDVYDVRQRHFDLKFEFDVHVVNFGFANIDFLNPRQILQKKLPMGHTLGKI